MRHQESVSFCWQPLPLIPGDLASGYKHWLGFSFSWLKFWCSRRVPQGSAVVGSGFKMVPNGLCYMVRCGFALWFAIAQARKKARGWWSWVTEGGNKPPLLPFLGAFPNPSLQKNCSFHFLGKGTFPTYDNDNYLWKMCRQRSCFSKAEHKDASVPWASDPCIARSPAQWVILTWANQIKAGEVCPRLRSCRRSKYRNVL